MILFDNFCFIVKNIIVITYVERAIHIMHILYYYLLLGQVFNFIMLLGRSIRPGFAGKFAFATKGFTPNTKLFFSSSSSSNSNSISSKFNYHVAVSYIPKPRNDDTNILNPTGEDNFVYYTKDDKILLGVADGVGGWSEVKNCSSADMSRELCVSLRQCFEKDVDQNSDLVALLENAYKETTKKVKVGGTTICFGVVEKDKIKVLNLGDSWFGQFRNFKLINSTKFQTLGFNTPYQLSIIPQKLLDEAKARGSNYIRNKPSDGALYEFDLQKDDILMFATDGLTDNVYPEDVEIFLKDHTDFELKNVTDSLVKEVQKLSFNEDFPSPFSQELAKLTGKNYVGGKVDDITVVIMKV